MAESVNNCRSIRFSNASNGDIVDMCLKEGTRTCVDTVLNHAPEDCDTTPNAIRHSVNKINEKYKLLKKSKNRKGGQENLDKFLALEYIYPIPRGPVIVCAPKSQEMNKAAVDDIATELRGNEDTIHCVEQENKAVLSDLNSPEQKLKNTDSDCAKLIKQNTVIQKQLESKKTEIEGHKKELMDSREQQKTTTVKLNQTQEKLKRKSLELKAANSREVYVRKKVAKLEELNQKPEADTAHLDEIDELTVHIDQHKEEIKNLKQENDQLRQLLKEKDDDSVLVYDEDKRVYLPNLQTCVYSLLEKHVSSSRISNVIEIVLSLAGKKANKLPSVTTIQNMNLQRLALSQKQVGELLSQPASTTLYTDETTKFGNKVMGYHVRDQEGKYFTLGLRDLTTKSGKDSLETFKELLNDIDTRAEDETNLTSKAILTNICSTMSDSASTEKKFNELLQDYRLSVLPYTVNNWDNLDDASQQSVGTLMNFFCGMHSLVHMAETSSSSLCEAEKALFEPDKPPAHDPSFVKSGESGSARLVRTACKAFARGADDKNGCHQPFLTFSADFLRDNNCTSLKLVPYRGNRFNILFFNAGLVYFLHKVMTDFLSGYGLNRLTTAVLHDLKTPIYVAGCKALGLISKLVTTPLWNLLEDKTIHILDMPQYYLMLRTGLLDAAQDPDKFMLGQLRPFGNHVLAKEDSVYRALVKPNEDYDPHCITLLSIVLPALAKYVERKFADYLPGGKLLDLPQAIRERTCSVDKHNKFCEQVFAYHDQLLRFKPHIQTLASEAYIMFATNKTSEWLLEKSKEEELKQLVSDARKCVASIRRKFKLRKQEIQQKRLAKIQEDREAKKKAEEKKLKEKELVTQDILYYGLWQSTREVDELLKSYPSNQAKTKALKAQLRFRKDVLQQSTGDPKVYSFSKQESGRRVQLNWEELAVNVKTCVQHAFSLDEEPSSCDNVLLAGKRVKHKLVANSRAVWYPGKVVSLVPGYPTWYNIVYDDDKAVYTYQLQDDYRDGNLKILI